MALRVAAIAIVVTPVHEKKNTDEIIKINAFKNWYLYACFSSLTHILNMMKIPAMKDIMLPTIKFNAKSIKTYPIKKNDLKIMCALQDRYALKNSSSSSSVIGSGRDGSSLCIILKARSLYSLASFDSGYFSTTVFASNSAS